MKYTVKILTGLILLTIIIIGFSLYTQSYLNQTSVELEKHINTIESGIKAGDWNTVFKNLDETDARWKHSKKGWATLIDHQEIDNIDETLSRMQEFIKTKDVPSALAEASALKLYLRHIPDKESLNIENIL
jgi:squalene cyclase